MLQCEGHCDRNICCLAVGEQARAEKSLLPERVDSLTARALRSLDALHVATALHVDAELVLSYDARQSVAARAAAQFRGADLPSKRCAHSRSSLSRCVARREASPAGSAASRAASASGSGAKFAAKARFAAA